MRTLRALPALAVLALAGVSFTSSAFAQSPADALRAEAKPLGLKDVPDDYRAVTLGTNDVLSPLMMFGAMGGSSRPSERLLLRSLSAIWVQPDEFAELLDGKRPRVRGYRLDLATLMGMGKVPTPVFVESWIEAGRVVTWSPAPDLAKPALTQAFAEEANRSGETTEAVAAEASVALPNEATAVDRPGMAVPVSPRDRTPGERTADLKQIALATIMFVQDNDERFPVAPASDHLPAKVGPYVRSTEVFAPSTTTGRVLYNTHLSGVELSSIARPAEVPLLWEERASADGRRVVAYVDGHVIRVDAAGWARAQRAEKDRRADK